MRSPFSRDPKASVMAKYLVDAKISVDPRWPATQIGFPARQLPLKAGGFKKREKTQLWMMTGGTPVSGNLRVYIVYIYISIYTYIYVYIYAHNYC